MPRVVPDQREKFENDELFRKMSRESEVGLCLRRCQPIDYNRLSICYCFLRWIRCCCVGVS